MSTTSMNRIADVEIRHTRAHNNVGAITSDSGMNDLFGPFVTEADAGHSEDRQAARKTEAGRCGGGGKSKRIVERTSTE